jgi:hypothetical protein
MKKTRCSFLAVLLLLSLVLPACAVAIPYTSHPVTELTATCSVPEVTIDVTVPQTATATINPSGATVQIGDTLDDGQILTSLAYIENQSEVPVSVDVAITGSVNKGSDMELLSKSAKSLKYKAAQVFFQIKAVTDPEDVVWDSSYNAKKHVLVLDGTEEKEKIVTIGAASQENRFGAFRLSGNCSTKFSDPDESWTEDDGFTATIVFTFKAVPLT